VRTWRLLAGQNTTNLPSRAVYALLIINKAGGLVYNREFHSGLDKLGSNDLLILAGSFHGVHAITGQLAPPSVRTARTPGNFPVKSTGIEVLESTHFRLSCFQTLTGAKFLLFTEPTQPNVDLITRRVYELYADFVMKNPFYTVEMPIRCQKFDAGLDQYIKARG
jgi:trafficking protein particle complex subunit 4